MSEILFKKKNNSKENTSAAENFKTKRTNERKHGVMQHRREKKKEKIEKKNITIHNTRDRRLRRILYDDNFVKH